MITATEIPVITDCSRCDALASCRKHIVNGSGKPGARVMFVGQSPLDMDDEEGKPFYGDVGKILRTLCDIVGLNTRDTYRTYANRCKTPGNRRPNTAELEACHEYLLQEIQVVQPAVIVALGDAAFESLYFLPNRAKAQATYEAETFAWWEEACSMIQMEYDLEIQEWNKAVEEAKVAKWKKPLKPSKPKMPPKPKVGVVDKPPLTNVVGQTLIQPETGIPLIPTYAPGWLFNNWSGADMVIAHFEKARRIGYEEQGSGELGEYVTIKSLKQLRALRDYLLDDRVHTIYYDTETTGLSWMDDELLCISLATQAGEGFVVPILQQGAVLCDWWEGKYPQVIEILKEIFGADKRYVAQNTLFDVAMLEREASWPNVTAATAFGIKIGGEWADTELQHQLVAETQRHNMDNVLSLHTDMPYYGAEIRQQSKNKTRMELVENEVLWKYSAADADGLARIENALDPIIDKEGTRFVLDNIANPLLKLCWDMTQRGTLIDLDLFNRLIAFYDDRIQEEEAKLFELLADYDWTRPVTDKQKETGRRSSGEPKYLHAPRMQDILFNWLKLPASGRATKGAKGCEACKKDYTCPKHDQTGEAALQEIYELTYHPVLPVYLSLKKLTKIKSTYLDGGKGGWHRYIRKDNRIHSTVQVSRAETGRLAYKDPNQQQAPKEIHIHPTGDDYCSCSNYYDETYGINSENAFRDLIIAPQGKGIMNVDWEMLEVWVLAYELAEQFSDPTLLEVLESGQDVHTWAARQIWSDLDPDLEDWKWREIHSDKRNKGKIFVFGNNYGLTIQGAMDRLGCTEEEAKLWTDRYLAKIPGLPRYVAWVKKMLIEKGYVPNKFGRRRHSDAIPLLKALNRRNDIDALARECQNFPIQSTGSDIHAQISAITNAYEPLLKRGCVPLFSVHDSLTFEFDYPNEEYALETAWIIKDLWQKTASNLLLPDGSKLGWNLFAEAEWGLRWGSPTHKLSASGEYKEML